MGDGPLSIRLGVAFIFSALPGICQRLSPWHSSPLSRPTSAGLESGNGFRSEVISKAGVGHLALQSRRADAGHSGRDNAYWSRVFLGSASRRPIKTSAGCRGTRRRIYQPRRCTICEAPRRRTGATVLLSNPTARVTRADLRVVSKASRCRRASLCRKSPKTRTEHLSRRQARPHRQTEGPGAHRDTRLVNRPVCGG